MSFLDRLFRLSDHGTNVRTEILAGLTSFATLAYVILLIPQILSKSGMNLEAVMIATLLAAFYSTTFMGLWANYPFVLGPGVALAVYFSYSVVLTQGHSWEAALGVVFLCGVTFVILNLLKIRQLLIEVIPLSLRIGTTAGMGLFLAFVAMQNAEIIVSSKETLLGFGNPLNPLVYMTMLGVAIIGIFIALRVRGAIILGILIVWILGLIFGLSKWQGIFSLPSSLAPTFFKLNIPAVFHEGMIDVFISFFVISLFDTSGMLIGLAEQGQFLQHTPGQKRSHFPRLSKALVPDATGSILCSFFGTSTLTVYLESAAGISLGGRTGLTSVVVGILFLLCLFFGDLVASIPIFAITPAILLVGGFMIHQIARLKWDDPTDWIPAFLTLVFIPLTFSVANGIGLGFIFFAFLKFCSGKGKQVHWFVYVIAILFLAKFIFLPEA